MKYIVKSLLLLSVIGMCFTSCSLNDDNPEVTSNQNIVELLTATPELSSLLAAIQRANLDTALQADGNFTVLAPSNAAFDSFLSSNGFSSLEDVPEATLTQVLLNHVIPGSTSAFKSSDLVSVGAGYVSTLAEGPVNNSTISSYFNTNNGIVFNGLSSVTMADIGASNGIVHIVDTVIPLPSVVTFVVADPNFSTLASALTELTPATDFVGLLNTPNGGTSSPFTVFAPVNNAFDKLASIPAEDILTPVLSHHVITGGNVRAEDINDSDISPATFEGDALTFNILANGAVQITDGSGQSGTTVISANLQTSNGVIHALDTVLIPNLEN